MFHIFSLLTTLLTSHRGKTMAFLTLACQRLYVAVRLWIGIIFLTALINMNKTPINWRLALLRKFGNRKNKEIPGRFLLVRKILHQKIK